jgi:hypothetical protein
MVLFELRNPQVFINRYKIKSEMAVLKKISVVKTRQLERHMNCTSPLV